TAYRTPNAYEQYYYPQVYRSAGFAGADTAGLDRERTRSLEVIVEHAVAASQRLSLSAFENRIDDLITLAPLADGSIGYINADKAHTRGAEAEWQAAWASGTRLRAAYTWQQGRDGDGNALP